MWASGGEASASPWLVHTVRRTALGPKDASTTVTAWRGGARACNLGVRLAQRGVGPHGKPPAGPRPMQLRYPSGHTGESYVGYSGETDHRFRCEAGQRFRSNWTPFGAKRRGSGIMSRGGWSGSTLVVVFASILPCHGHVPGRGGGYSLVRIARLANRAMLREVRRYQHDRGPEREADALLVPGLPQLFQRPHRNRAFPYPHPAPQVGDRYLPRTDQPQGRQQHETTPGHRGKPALPRGSCSIASGKPGAARMAKPKFAGPVEVDETYMGGKRRT